MWTKITDNAISRSRPAESLVIKTNNELKKIRKHLCFNKLRILFKTFFETKFK